MDFPFDQTLSRFTLSLRLHCSATRLRKLKTTFPNRRQVPTWLRLALILSCYTDRGTKRTPRVLTLKEVSLIIVRSVVRPCHCCLRNPPYQVFDPLPHSVDVRHVVIFTLHAAGCGIRDLNPTRAGATPLVN